MRYEDWDILLFPRDCKVPVKEFKVACHVVHDAEFSHSHGSVGLPTVCCFVPSLAAGTPFQISIHSWSSPAISQFTRCFSKYAESVNFEARLFIDGRQVASASLDRKSSWPHVIAHSFEFSKNGELEPLRFPSFRQEILQQSFWSPADDLGRIKIFISESFPRDPLSMPTERVKNIVAFSFQHAPLDILEASSIAWPNPSMWRRTPFIASMPAPAYPSDDVDLHAHSPRRRRGVAGSGSAAYSMQAIQGMITNTAPSNGKRKLNRQGRSSLSISANGNENGNTLDHYSDANAYFEWLCAMGGTSDTTSQYSGQSVVSNTGPKARKSSNDGNTRDCIPMGHSIEPSVAIDQAFTLTGFPHEDDGSFGNLKVPTNTPTVGASGGCETEGIPFLLLTHNTPFPGDVANSLSNSLLNQPMPAHMLAHNAHAPTPEMRSRKENRLQRSAVPSPSTISSTSTSCKDHCDVPKTSQHVYSAPSAKLPVGTVNSPQGQVCSDIGQPIPCLGDFAASLGTGSTGDSALANSCGNSIEKGTKRSRSFVTASAGVIEDEDESRRASPRVRLSPFANDSPTTESQ